VLKLSERYLLLNSSIGMPEGETWSAYEYEYLHLENVKRYGQICGLEALLTCGVDAVVEKSKLELEKITKEEGL
jgi:hypothetical protein